jgi:hypothetical protein
MTERSFFDWRTAFPGYTFLLVILAFNYVPLMEILKDQLIQSTFGTVLAFLTLVSGSAIGFLVSQVWWWHFQFKGAQYFYHSDKKDRPRPEIDELITKYDLKEAKNHRDKKQLQKVLAVYGYITHSHMEKQPEVVRYTQRRWDQFHAFSATQFALLLSAFIGIFFRVIFEFSIFDGKFNVSVGGIEIIILILLCGAIFVLYLLFRSARNWVSEQYSNVSKAIINKSRVKLWQLKEIFKDDEYYKSNTNKQKS